MVRKPILFIISTSRNISVYTVTYNHLKSWLIFIYKCVDSWLNDIKPYKKRWLRHKDVTQRQRLHKKVQIQHTFLGITMITKASPIWNYCNDIREWLVDKCIKSGFEWYKLSTLNYILKNNTKALWVHSILTVCKLIISKLHIQTRTRLINWIIVKSCLL